MINEFSVRPSLLSPYFLFIFQLHLIIKRTHFFRAVYATVFRSNRFVELLLRSGISTEVAGTEAYSVQDNLSVYTLPDIRLILDFTSTLTFTYTYTR